MEVGSYAIPVFFPAKSSLDSHCLFFSNFVGSDLLMLHCAAIVANSLSFEVESTAL